MAVVPFRALPPLLFTAEAAENAEEKRENNGFHHREHREHRENIEIETMASFLLLFLPTIFSLCSPCSLW
jgi:hypothetical protein